MVFARSAVLAFFAAMAITPQVASATAPEAVREAALEVETAGAAVGLEEFDADDECLSAGQDGEGSAECSFNALQRRVLRMNSAGAASSRTVLDAPSSGASFLRFKNAALAKHGVSFNASGMEYDLTAMGAPPKALNYDGLAHTNLVVHGPGPTHFFAIGDWGGMDGAFDPGHGHARVIAYPGGQHYGPHVFPRTRWNKAHSMELCDHSSFLSCYKTNGRGCNPGCGYVEGIDDKAQLLVANAFNSRAAMVDPKFVLNVGDNFYWGGLEVNCGTPMNQASRAQSHQFDSIYNSIYHGHQPWISALGNHDWGGRVFTNGWDQQIAYTWRSSRWVMPASYFSQHVDYPDQGFSVDIFVVDDNKEDAKSGLADIEHNICGVTYNKPGASCASAGGPPSVMECMSWFHTRWAKQQQWLRQNLAKSKANWQIVVGHFPCDTDRSFYSELHNKYGLDLRVTGHRHDQELQDPKRNGGLTCFVTGGGGGISSEATPNPMVTQDWYGEAQYGFYDITITKEKIKIESINWDGKVVKEATVFPDGGGSHAEAAPEPSSPAAPGASPSVKAASCAAYGCVGYTPSNTCQCNAACRKHNSCCADFSAKCQHHHR